MTSPSLNHDHMWTDTERGLVRSCGMYPPAHARGEHDRVDDHSEFNGWAVSPPASRRCVTNLPETGRAFGLGAFSRIHGSGQPSSLAVSALGAGVMDSSICHPRCTLPSRSRSVDLREQPVEITIVRRHGHRLQNIAKAPHNHVQTLSSALVASDRNHAAKGQGSVPNPCRAFNKTEGETPDVVR